MSGKRRTGDSWWRPQLRAIVAEEYRFACQAGHHTSRISKHDVDGPVGSNLRKMGRGGAANGLEIERARQGLADVAEPCEVGRAGRRLACGRVRRQRSGPDLLTLPELMDDEDGQDDERGQQMKPSRVFELPGAVEQPRHRRLEDDKGCRQRQCQQQVVASK